jgi:hypothetical protein
MTSARFDTVVAALARARTRRAAFMVLIGPAVFYARRPGMSASAGGGVLAASCRGKGSNCRKGGNCCSGRCEKHRGKNKKKGKCRCSRYLEPCSKDSDCCAFEAPLVCASGTCQT